MKKIDVLFYVYRCKLSKVASRIKWSLEDVRDYGLKQFILKSVWDVLCFLDKGDSYSYETAPYCGHHYSGFENRFIESSYWEGMGGGQTKFSLFGYRLHYCTESEIKYFLRKS